MADPMVRLQRGGAEFIRAVAEHFIGLGERSVYSPALYRGASDVWRRAGFRAHESLLVMERSLSGSVEPVDGVSVTDEPDWDEIHRLDLESFHGFWGMSRLGLMEAYDTNRTSAILTTHSGGELAGYSLLGTQWGVTYLHRIAVHPDQKGKGHGRRLVQASIGWGRNTGGRTMVLNVRPGNTPARSLYGRLGFADAGADLAVFRYDELLN